MIKSLLHMFKGTIFHPQWLSDRFHLESRKILTELRDATVLDIGSGNSDYKDLIHSSNCFYTLDYPGTNVRYLFTPQLYGDARHLPIADASLDVVLLFEVLEHVLDINQVMVELKRVLKSGGKLYISVPFIYPIHDAPNDYWRFTSYGLREILTQNGFEVNHLVIHGNTLIAGMQMVTLGQLEICRDLLQKKPVMGAITGMLVYPLILFINMLAWPLLYLRLGNAGCFGYFVHATRIGD